MSFKQLIPNLIRIGSVLIGGLIAYKTGKDAYKTKKEEGRKDQKENRKNLKEYRKISKLPPDEREFVSNMQAQNNKHIENISAADLEYLKTIAKNNSINFSDLINISNPQIINKTPVEAKILPPAKSKK